MTSTSVIAEAKRLVVKVGSSLVTDEGRGLDRQALARWSAQIARLRAMGKDVVLVSSGAIAEGMLRLGWDKRPTQIPELQAAAAVGQMGLAQAYETSFAQHGIHTAQILLTHDDLSDRRRYLNARSTLFTLLRLGVVPIINENDTVVTDEIKFGDNDTLGSLVTNLIEADALVILTDQAGLYSADPRKQPDARFISQANAGDPALELMAGGAGSSLGRGGMLTKILAAKRAAGSGAHTVIASGREPNILERLAGGECIGTELRASVPMLSARKQWLADHLQLRAHHPGRRGRQGADPRWQEPAADRRHCRGRGVRARRCGRVHRRVGPGTGPGADQLFSQRHPADHAQGVQPDRRDPGQHGSARTDASR
jgi:glutamate 5-kinase